ncbi:hypothetical protein D822_04019 [Streptococcus ratti FA-1 = DSM 20564]|uniref:Uncharacterized protein n=1 Tax=Streptococcus ratti FA-1 = DSM 20564 TaxID=699248 RepID=A0ABN0GX23_STRRT|nr:hypothetical protein SRA_00093 [Streptococcus ratti FA-1 = DSM 20564]EMP70516.1 hypothetical protein D822_04019 [Streptococcus ratti FA-1 = DSM 20564]QEY07056.1 hypothetical protein FY406_05070 [Streptococcus ratti]
MWGKTLSNTILKQLEVKANRIKEEILKHNFFKINREEAIMFLISRLETSVRISGGKLFSNFQKDDFFRENEKLVNIIQTSLPFIFRNLKEESQVNNVKIEVNELVLLIQQIYDYLEFKKYIQLFKNKVVNVVVNNQKIRFEYKSDVCRINEIYNGYWHMKEQQNAIEGVRNLQDITDNMFDLTVDINLGNFTLEKYKIFCKGIDILMQDEYAKTVMIAGEIGYLKFKKKEWIAKLSHLVPELGQETIGYIIDFLTYDFEDINSDPILSYFIPIKGNLILSLSLFSSQRLDKNILRLLNQKNPSLYQNEQKKLEFHQINELESQKLNIYDFDTDKNGSPGEDLIVYDKVANAVHVIELKYKLPVDTVNEIRNLSNLLTKANKQNIVASESLTVDNVFEKYFDNKYKGYKPNKIIFFSLTNYSIDYFSDNSIMLIQHYAQLLKKDKCSKRLEMIFNDKFRGLNLQPKIKFKKINLFGNKIKIPFNYSEFPLGQELKY